MQQRFQGRGIVNKQSKVSAQHRLLTVCWPAVRLEIPDLRCRFLSSRTFSWDREGLSLLFSVAFVPPHSLGQQVALPCAGLCPKVATLNISSLDLFRFLVTL